MLSSFLTFPSTLLSIWCLCPKWVDKLICKLGYSSSFSGHWIKLVLLQSKHWFCHWLCEYDWEKILWLRKGVSAQAQPRTPMWVKSTNSIIVLVVTWVFPGGSVVKKLPANAGDEDLLPRSGRFPGERNGNPLQYFFLGSPMNRGTWKAAVHWVAKS